MSKRAHEYMTLRRAAVELFGWDNTRSSALKLRRIIQRKEKVCNIQIMERLGAAPSPLYVTMARLKDHMPELFSRRDETLRLVREELEDMREALAEGALRDRALAARIRKLEGWCREKDSKRLAR